MLALPQLYGGGCPYTELWAKKNSGSRAIAMTFCLVSMFLRKQVRNNNRQKARKEASNNHNENGSWEVLELLEYHMLHVKDISVLPSTESYLTLFMTQLHE